MVRSWLCLGLLRRRQIRNAISAIRKAPPAEAPAITTIGGPRASGPGLGFWPEPVPDEVEEVPEP